MNNKIKRIALDGFLLAILIVASKISFSVLTVAFSLQLLAVLIISKLTSTVDGILIIAIYLVMGLIGIPVFATANAGISYVLLPSFGFIIGFIAVVLFVNQFKNRIKNTLIIAKIAQNENIQVTPQELQSKIEDLAYAYNTSLDVIYEEIRKNSNIIHGIGQQALMDKVSKFLAEKNTVNLV